MLPILLAVVAFFAVRRGSASSAPPSVLAPPRLPRQAPALQQATIAQRSPSLLEWTLKARGIDTGGGTRPSAPPTNNFIDTALDETGEYIESVANTAASKAGTWLSHQLHGGTEQADDEIGESVDENGYRDDDGYRP